LKFNLIEVNLPIPTEVEVIILEEMILNLKGFFSFDPKSKTKSHFGSPYFFQGNSRLMYFPHKYLIETSNLEFEDTPALHFHPY
jgi:hypothetical protein